MQLAELSAEERDYLSRPLPLADAFAPALVKHLSCVLGARMKQTVQVQAAHQCADLDIAKITVPQISWDNALDTLWLHARLGRSNASVQTPSSALTKNLLRTLQLGLAEAWISFPSANTPNADWSLRMQITAMNNNTIAATLLIRLPSSRDMNQWAQHIIRHAS